MKKLFHFIESDPEIDLVKGALIQEAEAGSIDSTVKKGDGLSWGVTLFKFGKSARPPHFVYTKESAAQNLSIIDGARVYLNREADNYGHKDSNKKVAADQIAFLSNPVVGENSVTATMNIMPSAKWFKENLDFLQQKNRLDFYQLSIDAFGTGEVKMFEGQNLPHALKFVRFDVDVVSKGAAGGEFQKLQESLPFQNNNQQTQSQGKSVMNKTKILLATIFSLIYPAFLESHPIDFMKVDENEMFTHLLEANKPQDNLHLPDGFKLTEASAETLLKTVMTEAAKPPEKKDDKKTVTPDMTKFTEAMDNMQKQLKDLELRDCQHMLESAVATCGLPKPLQDHITLTFKGKTFKESELNTFILTTKDTFSKVVKEHPLHTFVEAGQDRKDKIVQGLEQFFFNPMRPLSADEVKTFGYKVPAFRSFKEAYIEITGDHQVTGMRKDAIRMTESFNTTDFANVVLDAMHNSLRREYGMLGLDTWRKFVEVVPVGDFRANYITGYGGYGNLPAVGEGGAYQPLTTPTDEKANYTAAKKGGTEYLTFEMIKNDNISAIRRIPTKLAYAAARTLHEYVYDFIKPSNNPTIYDSLVLYVAGHANTGTTALGADGSGIQACRVLMSKLTEKNSSKRLGIMPKFVVIPIDLADSAYKSVTAAYGMYNATPTQAQSWNMEVIEVPYWTDATDYVVIANPAQVIGMQVGFLDGKEEPELFTSDIPNVGSLFTNDAITMKIRHIYAGAICDYRAFVGQVVAN